MCRRQKAKRCEVKDNTEWSAKKSLKEILSVTVSAFDTHNDDGGEVLKLLSAANNQLLMSRVLIEHHLVLEINFSERRCNKMLLL
jgi:hypothetical protein